LATYRAIRQHANISRRRVRLWVCGRCSGVPHG
jgi:hypothetical protein